MKKPKYTNNILHLCTVPADEIYGTGDQKNIQVDCIGVDLSIGGKSTLQAVNYLQEIKGTIDAIWKLKELYFA